MQAQWTVQGTQRAQITPAGNDLNISSSAFKTVET